MSQILYFTDVAAGVRHATFVHSGGHILLRDVPHEEVETLKDTVREWRNTLPNVEGVTADEVTAFFDSQGFTHLPDFNPPLVAYSYAKAEGEAETTDPDSLAAMTVAQLRAYAADLGLTDTGELRKAELIAAIQAKLNEGNAPTGDGN